MSKKKQQSSGGLVYSTDPNFKLPGDDFEEQETIESAQQQHRAGKAVTLVENFIGTISDKEELGKRLKTFCGTGGSVKDGEIIIQGDNRDKVLQWLLKSGYKFSKKI